MFRVEKMNRKLVVISSLLAFLLGTSGEKLIVDTDAGGDDAVALLLLLRYEAANANCSFEVVGITCSYGNAKIENVVSNVLRTLTVAGRQDIPVYRGAARGFIEPFSTDYFFGMDGFGDAKFDWDVTTNVDESKHAAVALVDMVRQYSGNVSILTLGPLTNVALALALDSNFTNRVNKFYVMGTSVAGVGNRGPNVEFNIAADPESTFALFDAAKESQITLVPWETVFNTNFTKNWRKNVLGKYPSPYIRFLNEVESKSLALATPEWVSADATTAACMLVPSLIRQQVVRNVQVVTAGLARGSVLVDYGQTTGKTNNSKIVQKVDEAAYEKMLVKYLTCEEIEC